MPIITFDHVTINYGLGDSALDDVSFSIEPGEFIVISGKSGAGKTTLARVLIKEKIPTSGSVQFNGQDLADIKKSKVHLHRRHIGVIYQDYKLVQELTVGENIALALRIAGKDKQEIESRINDLLQLVQLPDKENYFPNQLSGGEIQRVSIARALANGPEVLFADEPTGNLDRETGKHIVQILRKINSLGTTVLMSTHEEFDFSDHPHRIFQLEKGKLTIKEGKLTKPSTKPTNPGKIAETPKVEQPPVQEAPVAKESPKAEEPTKEDSTNQKKS